MVIALNTHLTPVMMLPSMGNHTYHLSPRQRYQMVTDHLRGEKISTVCRFYGIPRKTLYHWIGVWRADQDNFAKNVAGADHTPKRQPRLTDDVTTERIVRLRKKSGYGPDRLKLLLAERGVIMSASGIAKVIGRAGLVKKRRRKEKKKYKKFTAYMTHPGQRVQKDVMYLPKLFGKTHRQYCYQAIDLFTRISFSHIYDECTPQNTVDFLKRAIAFFPFKVENFQFDHGVENTYDLRPDIRKIHPVQAFLASLGTGCHYSPIATPRMNGCVERLHRTWRQEVERHHHWKTPAVMHKDNAKWLKYYNEQRPHFGIKAMTPLEKLRSFKGYEAATINY